MLASIAEREQFRSLSAAKIQKVLEFRTVCALKVQKAGGSASQTKRRLNSFKAAFSVFLSSLCKSLSRDFNGVFQS